MDIDSIQACMNAILRECEKGSYKYTAVQCAMRIVEMAAGKSKFTKIYNKTVIAMYEIFSILTGVCGFVACGLLVKLCIYQNLSDLIALLGALFTAPVLMLVAWYLSNEA